MTTDEPTFEGSCFCRKVRYNIRGSIGPMDHCHCVDCRKSHGAAFATYVAVPRDGFRFVSGEDHLTTYAAESGTTRSFCRTCGTIVICRWSDGGREGMQISASTLDTPSGLKPASHSFIRSKDDWFDITYRLPQYETHVPAGGPPRQ